MRHDWDSDEVLLDALRDALSTPSEEVPPEFVEAAKAAFTWRTIDEELLLITSYDSVLDDELMARARSTATTRQLVFDAEGVSLQVEVSAAGITGQLMPPSAGEVVLLTPSGAAETAVVDELGMFVMGPARGPIRFRFATGCTDWICL